MSQAEARAVLFVCLGNICRSPTAEAVFRARAPSHLWADSAGTGGWHVGDPPHPPMQLAAAARGYDLQKLRARQLSPADFERFDLILAMDARNLDDIRAGQPKHTSARSALLLDFSPDTPLAEVPDPYYTGDFDQTLDLVEMAVDGLLAYLEQPSRGRGGADQR